MSNPVAAHTFDNVRVYLSTRTGGAPGSGVWTNPVTLFDGTQQIATLPVCGTFSAGSLLPTDPYGIVCNSDNNDNELMFLADGLPTTPYIISYSGQTGFIQSGDYWDTSQGAFYYDGSAGGTAGYYLPHYTTVGNNLHIIKSIDGTTWAECDAINHPAAGDGTALALQRVDHFLYFFISLDFSDTNWSILPFDMSTGLYGVPFAAITISNFKAFSQSNGDSWTNGLFKFPNGDFAVIYQEQDGTQDVVYRLWDQAGSTWGPTLTLPSGSVGYATSILDALQASVHVLTYGSFNISGPVNYHNITHPGNVLTTVASVIAAAATVSIDGVGHSSIQNGMIFAPRDDNNDFDNSVWVSTLPVTGAFSKELLPVPVGETDAVGTVSIANIGAGYAASQYLAINGGSNPAFYLVTGVDGGGGIVSGGVVYRGGGYSVGSNVGVTGGSGTGFEINILTILPGKTPSCAYMMFPNGYSLAGTCQIVVSSGPIPPPVVVLPCPTPFDVLGPEDPNVLINEPYSINLVVIPGNSPITTAPYVLTITTGSLPTGLTLTGTTISGTPAVAGTFAFTVTVTDAFGLTVSEPFLITVSNPPAQL